MCLKIRCDGEFTVLLQNFLYGHGWLAFFYALHWDYWFDGVAGAGAVTLKPTLLSPYQNIYRFRFLRNNFNKIYIKKY
jgi:hypothetical protein